MLSKGRSWDWQSTLANFLGDSNAQMSAKAMLNYFSPLMEFLEEQIQEHNIEVREI